ncbi:MAG TPA: MFS transporter [Acetobacteraceae bacterium]|nr:MFS transporter [Acetobacteraceae bacterium]
MRAAAERIGTAAGARVLADRRLWLMFAFGALSGLPLALSGFTLRQWLTEAHLSLAVTGLSANIGISYTLKFLWAPVMDQAPAPFGLARFGRRRGWLLAVQPPLALAALALALSDAATAPLATIAAAAVIAFLSASQDIVIDAWRIETFEERLQGAANAAYVWGYRLAMLVSGAGVIALAGTLGWHGALLLVAALLAAGPLVTWRAAEPPLRRAAGPAARGVVGRLSAAVLDPLRDFLRRPGAGAILAYVATFKLGEAMAGVMLAPFFHDLGFNRAAVAAAIGPFSLAATIAGYATGAAAVARLGLARALILTGFCQMGAMAMYVWLAVSPGHHALLYATVVVEAFAEGVADAAFLTYLSGLCSAGHTATQYALLSSIAPLALRTIGGLSGFIAAAVGWPVFYTLAMLASLPAMLLMLRILRRWPTDADRATPGLETSLASPRRAGHVEAIPAEPGVGGRDG